MSDSQPTERSTDRPAERSTDGPTERSTDGPTQGSISGSATRGATSGVGDVEAALKALKFFEVMAFVVGAGLLVLVLEMVLRYGFDNHALDWWPQPHGFIYMVYLVATANLGFKMRWGLGKMVLVMLAGVVPFLSFWAERKVASEVGDRLAAARR